MSAEARANAIALMTALDDNSDDALAAILDDQSLGLREVWDMAVVLAAVLNGVVGMFEDYSASTVELLGDTPALRRDYLFERAELIRQMTSPEEVS